MRFGSPRGSPSLNVSAVSFEPSTVVGPEVMRSILDVERMEFLAQQLTTRTSLLSGKNFQIADVRRNGGLTVGADEMENARRSEIVDALKNPQWISLMSTHSGKRMFAPDCQIHQMHTGADLPSHSHGDHIFGILHFSRTYEGGKYYEMNGAEKMYPNIAPFSLVITRSGIEHGVESVTAGTRIVLVSVWAPSKYKS